MISASALIVLFVFVKLVCKRPKKEEKKKQKEKWEMVNKVLYSNWNLIDSCFESVKSSALGLI